ncbi:MAG: DHH family phosphoesterase [Peptostreptococcaceae bacterium]
MKDLSFEMDEITKKSIMNLPTPLCVIEFDGDITWYNDKFDEMINKKDLMGSNIEDIMNDLNLRKVLNENKEMYSEISFNDREYDIIYRVIKNDKVQNNRYLMVIYFFDKTDKLKLELEYEDNKNAIALIQIDGYDEVLKSTPEDKRLLLNVDIEKILSSIENETKGALRRISKENYILIFDKKSCINLEKDKFSVLDKIRDISQENTLPVTISIGIGRDGESINEHLKMATSSLDLALGRGGDQVVVKSNDKFIFYGGKSKAIEKTTKVKSRLIGHALKQIILESEKIYIMGHKYPDMDAMGAAVGVYEICKSFNKDAKIILDKTNDSIKEFTDRIENSKFHEDIFIKCDDAIEDCTKDTLVVVVDTHRPNYTECEEILNISDKVAVIDHHRRGIDFINETVLLFHETYVSSTCELITELVQYVDDDVKINKLTAEGLLAGISLDTKSFTFKTGVRTFEAASYLKKLGADTVEVKKLFNSNINDVVIRAEIIQSAKMIGDNICIASSIKEDENINIIVAQAADELLNIKDVEASFVLGMKNKKVFISARSLGNMNVHVIMEKLGGGGHKDVAGAQLDLSFEDSIKLLRETIDKHLEEEK